MSAKQSCTRGRKHPDSSEGKRRSEYGIIPNLSRIRWNNDHRNTNCTRKCCESHNEHFSIWKLTYGKYIEGLYSIFSRAVNPSKVNFLEFAEFAYSNSSGYISRFT